jgi:ATP-dependent Clp protease protease subunit
MAVWNFLRRLVSTKSPRTAASHGSDLDINELLKARVVPISGMLTDEVANTAIAMMLFLRKEGTGPIEVRIDSDGGEVAAGLAIFDTIIEVADRTHTYCHTKACGMAALILAAGTRGHRIVGSAARIQIAPLTSAQPNDLAAQSECNRLETIIAQLLSRHTGRSLAHVLADVRAGRNFDAERAVAYGLADQIRPLPPAAAGQRP